MGSFDFRSTYPKFKIIVRFESKFEISVHVLIQFFLSEMKETFKKSLRRKNQAKIQDAFASTSWNPQKNAKQNKFLSLHPSLSSSDSYQLGFS